MIEHEKSEGHLNFILGFEYLSYQGVVLRASVATPLEGGFRRGWVLCPISLWPQVERRLQEWSGSREYSSISEFLGNLKLSQLKALCTYYHEKVHHFTEKRGKTSLEDSLLMMCVLHPGFTVDRLRGALSDCP